MFKLTLASASFPDLFPGNAGDARFVFKTVEAVSARMKVFH